MNATIIASAIAAVCIAAGGGYALGEFRGHASGVLEIQAQQDATKARTLADGLKTLQDQVADSLAANQSVRAAMTSLETQNKTSSTELKNAIAKSRPAGAVVCHFDPDSMRIIAAAADRADALAANGLAAARTGGTLPVGDSADGR